MRTILSLSLCMMMVGCSAAQVQKDQAVVIKLKADAQTLIVTGCQNLPATEVAISTVLALVPPGTDKSAFQAGYTVGGTAANALCAQVKTLQTTPAPPPAVTVNPVRGS